MSTNQFGIKQTMAALYTMSLLVVYILVLCNLTDRARVSVTTNIAIIAQLPKHRGRHCIRKQTSCSLECLTGDRFYRSVFEIC